MAGELMPLKDLLSQWGNAPLAEFVACARYYEDMDVVLYLQEDVTYRADRVDMFLTLLWHPHEDRAIGVKLKGFRYLFQRFQKIVEGIGIEISDSHFLPLISAIEVAVTAGLGKKMTADTERQRIDEKYATAKEIVANVKLDTRDLLIAA